MPLKVIRRPYQDCAYRWALSTSGISTGEGDCSESQCLDLNGDFLLDFSACDSKGGKLVWAGDCEAASSDQNTPCAIDGCGSASRSISWDGVMPDIPAGVTRSAATAFTGTLTFNQTSNSISGCCSWRGIGEETIGVEDNERSLVPFVPEYGDTWPLHQKYWHASFSYGAWTVKLKYEAVFIASADKMALLILMHVMPDDPSDPDILTTVEAIYEVDTTGECEESYTLERVTLDARTVCEKSHVITSPQVWIWSDEYTVSGLSGGDGSTGPETNDRIRSKWNLEYDIEATLWTLRSFERVDYPVYTLSDASPCDGDTKTLTLADKGSSADGCGVAPAEVTITRVCPPDRVGKSALLEDRKPNGATGKRKRQCGCDCLDEVDDRRHTCTTKCASAATEGCERIDPAPDDITCRYPEAINCCATTAGKDVPCAYTVEFECDLFFDDGEDVRHKIAAKQVTLRRECYFEDPCLFVAPGPESSTGGSPVMDTDGFPGAQPVCSSCEDLCLTGCTWSAWTVAACPDENAPCGDLICEPDVVVGSHVVQFIASVGPIFNVGTSSYTTTEDITLSPINIAGQPEDWIGEGSQCQRCRLTLQNNCVTLAIGVACEGTSGYSLYYKSNPRVFTSCPSTIQFVADYWIFTGPAQTDFTGIGPTNIVVTRV